eukprot:g6675.t1
MRYFPQLLTHCFSPKQPTVELEDAIRHHDRNAVKKCIQRKLNLNSPSPKSGSTPLCLAIKAKDQKMMKLLISHGAFIEQKFDCDWTALFLACALGFLDGVKLLINYGADTKVQSSTGLNCLLVAAKNGHLSVVSYLLDHDSNGVNSIGKDGYSALHYVALSNDSAATSKLIHKGVRINAQTPDGSTAVFLATKHNKLNSLRALLEAGADPNVTTRKAAFALHEAVHQGNVEAVRLLLRHNGDPMKIGKDGQTPMELAKFRESQDRVIYFLLKNKSATCSTEEVAWRYKFENERKNREKLEEDMDYCTSCPISLTQMKDPVIAADGHTYERKVIEQWLSRSGVSPITQQPLANNSLVPNLIIKRLISDRKV